MHHPHLVFPGFDTLTCTCDLARKVNTSCEQTSNTAVHLRRASVTRPCALEVLMGTVYAESAPDLAIMHVLAAICAVQKALHYCRVR